MKRALPLLLAIGCTPSFEAASEIRDLRVLAVQAEPPEAQYDAASVDPVHLRILAVDPPRKNNFALMKWDICAPTDSRRCLTRRTRAPHADATDTGEVLDFARARVEALQLMLQACCVLAIPPSSSLHHMLRVGIEGSVAWVVVAERC